MSRILNSVADRLLSVVVPRRAAGACGIQPSFAGFCSGSGAPLWHCVDPCHQVPSYYRCNNC